jgi:hypothetical protein
MSESPYHYCRRRYGAGNPATVRAVAAATAGEPGWMTVDDWHELSAERPLSDAEALAYLTHPDTAGGTPCSRYGRHSDDCASVAVAAATIVADECAEGLSCDLLDGSMSAVVNDSPEPLELIREYGTADQLALVAELLDES